MLARRGQLSVLTALVGLACTLSAPATTRPGTPVQAGEMPVSLRGVWQPVTADGRAACESYRSTVARAPDDPGAWPAPTGAIVIGGTLVHHVSENGEGNFLEVDRVEVVAPGRWRLRGRLGIDGPPGDEDPEYVSRELLLEGARMTWVDRSEAARSATAYMYCARRD